MTGRLTGNPNRITYYCVHRGFTVPTQDKVLRRLIPAEPLEKTVIGLVRDVLLAAPNLRQRLMKLIQKQQAQSQGDAANLKTLESHRKKLQCQLEFIIDALGDVGQEAARAKLRQLEQNLIAVDERIEKAKRPSSQSQPDSGSIADQLIERMKRMGETLHELPIPALRQVLRTMISRAEGDMETKRLDLELALPEWTVADTDGSKALCPVANSSRRSAHEAQVDLVLDRVNCQYRLSHRVPCFDCQRSRKAA